MDLLLGWPGRRAGGLGELTERRAAALWLGAGLAAALGWYLLAALDPLARGDFVFCLFRRLSGVPCPGCGLTRAFLHLVDGDLVASMRLHPAAPVLGGELALAWLVWGWRVSGREGGPARQGWVAPWAGAHAVALIGLWIGRLASGSLPH